MKLKKMYLLIFVVIYALISATNNYLEAQFKEILPEIRFPMEDNIILLNDSLNFEGYMIFKVEGNLECFNLQDSNFKCEIYWIKDLNQINNPYYKYYYTIAWGFYQSYAWFDENDFIVDSSKLDEDYIKKIKSEDFLEFKNFFVNFLNDKELPPPFLKKPLTTILFDSVKSYFYANFSEINNTGYFIYKCSFKAAVINYNCTFYKRVCKANVSLIEEKSEENINFILPVSPLYKFSSIDVTELPKNFGLAKWFPNYIFEKQ